MKAKVASLLGLSEGLKFSVRLPYSTRFEVCLSSESSSLVYSYALFHTEPQDLKCAYQVNLHHWYIAMHCFIQRGKKGGKSHLKPKFSPPPKRKSAIIIIYYCKKLKVNFFLKFLQNHFRSFNGKVVHIGIAVKC